MIPSGSLACVAYNTIREVENARSKFRQETFETLAKFNLKSFVLFSCCFFLRIGVNPFALSTCTLQTGVAGKNHTEKKKSFVWTPMHRFRTLTKPAYSAARPLQHLLFHLFGPVPFSSSRARSASADQHANSLSCLCALACGWPKFQAALRWRTSRWRKLLPFFQSASPSSP